MAEAKYRSEDSEAQRDNLALSWVIDEYFEGLSADKHAAREQWLNSCPENRKAFELAQETWSHLTHSDTLTGLKVAENDEPESAIVVDMPAPDSTVPDTQISVKERLSPTRKAIGILLVVLLGVVCLYLAR